MTGDTRDIAKVALVQTEILSEEVLISFFRVPIKVSQVATSWNLPAFLL